ncbi:hypothetical protein ANCCEY_04086 [Ancylostoma ceylanicum]|uniref:DNA helicase Pif1-like 2B domain-containing protein n=1 Tax=Ancylostoma ceylanicum TaxID=53326 RepID=A0A0D6LYC0_9BILA|nr:hypothetical protein ANCCEY_04086 [Ancylostoma ceylanicum]
MKLEPGCIAMLLRNLDVSAQLCNGTRLVFPIRLSFYIAINKSLVQTFDKYRSTTSIGQADALSRLIASQPRIDEDRVIAAISVDADIQHVFINTGRVCSKRRRSSSQGARLQRGSDITGP